MMTMMMSTTMKTKKTTKKEKVLVKEAEEMRMQSQMKTRKRQHQQQRGRSDPLGFRIGTTHIRYLAFYFLTNFIIKLLYSSYTQVPYHSLHSSRNL